VLERYERAVAALEASLDERAAPDREPAVVLDAGPFAGADELSEFERALAGLPGARGVRVRGFEGDRAQLELRLARPLDLVEELRGALPDGLGELELREAALTVRFASRER
jgi:hypothetical protein